MERLMENYAQACRGRLRLWLGDDVLVTRSGPVDLLVERGARGVILKFEPATCRWRLENRAGPDFDPLEGSFDRLTKTVRRLFTKDV